METQLIASLHAGNYSITVTDALGCTAIDTATITEPPAISITFTTGDAACGDSTGFANASVSGGTSPYTYQWNIGETNNAIDSIAGGIYLV